MSTDSKGITMLTGDDCVVTIKCDNPWVMFSVGGNGNERFARQRIITERGECMPVQEFFVAILDRLDCKSDVVGHDGDVMAVDKLEARMERVGPERDVVAIQGQTTL